MEKTASDYIRGLPEKVSQHKLESIETNLHFFFTGERDEEITLRVEAGIMEALDGHHGEPECTVRANSTDFLDVVHGRLHPLNAVMTGKVKVSNQMAILKYASLLGFM